MAALVLFDQLLLGFTYESQIAVLIEVVIGLQEHHIFATLCLLMVKLENCFDVLLFEVFLLQFHHNLLSFFQFLESLDKHSQVLGNLLS